MAKILNIGDVEKHPDFIIGYDDYLGGSSFEEMDDEYRLHLLNDEQACLAWVHGHNAAMRDAKKDHTT